MLLFATGKKRTVINTKLYFHSQKQPIGCKKISFVNEQKKLHNILVLAIAHALLVLSLLLFISSLRRET